jgi:sarcosine oxidase
VARFGKRDGSPVAASGVVSGTLHSAKTHRLATELLSASDARRRFPGYRFPDNFVTVFEQDAGYLEVERCVAAHIEAALICGASLHTREIVLSFAPEGAGVRVRTDRGDYAAGRLIVTAGPWAEQVLRSCVLASGSADHPWNEWLHVVRKPVFWFEAGPQFDVARGNGTFFFEIPAGQYYGFPRIDGRTIKVAEHTLGDPVDDPLNVDRDLHASDLARMADFLREFRPGVVPSPVQHSVCMYTRTPDCHFVVDRHPDLSPVILGMGFSGHGFKFTSAIGQMLAELALDGSTSLPVGFLSLDRLRNKPRGN